MLVVDFETPRMEPGMQAPPPCVAGICGDADLVEDPHCVRAVEHEVSHVPAIWLISAASPQWPRVVELFGAGEHLLVNHRLRFDACCAIEARPDIGLAVLDRHRRGLAQCTEMRERLLDIAAGTFTSKEKYALGTVAARYGVEVASKDDGTRLRYHEIWQTPVWDWPEAARKYLALDVRSPYEVFLAQERRAANLQPGALDDAPRQTAWHLAMELISTHGVRTDPDMVARYRAETQDELDRGAKALAENGLIEWQRKAGKWKRDTKRAAAHAAMVWARIGIDPPTSPAGAIKLDAVAAEQSDDPLLIAYQKFGAATAAMSHVEEVSAGMLAPVHTHYDLVETGRTASWGPNLQNRKVKPGDRECFIPDPGYVYDDRDADGLELRTVAQVCVTIFGYSRLAEVLNSGGDPHLYLASLMPELRGCEYADLERRLKAKDPVVSACRQTAKIGNFGFAGGAGIAVFVRQAWAKYRVRISIDQARELKRLWTEAWPELGEYLRWIGTLAPHGRPATVRQLFSGRVRGGCKFTDTANGFFQALGGDACKAATFALQVACRTPGHVLYGCRPEHFVHDQWLTALREDDRMSERASAIKSVIETAANVYLPDVPMSASGCIARRWSKDARAMKDLDGNLLPWEWPPALDPWVARYRDVRPHVPRLDESMNELLALRDIVHRYHGQVAGEAKRLDDGPEKDALKARAGKLWREAEECAAYVSLARVRIDRGRGHEVNASLLDRVSVAIRERTQAVLAA